MEDLDFTRPSRHEIYDPAVARTCFESLGKAESIAQGQAFFAQGEASDKMYLLLEGEASLIRGKKMIDVVKAGEIFGEMAAITQQPRSATAMARGACRALSLDTRQFQRAIQQTPEFALMLMSIMINRLRLTVAMLSMTHSLPSVTGRSEKNVFDKKLMDELAAALRDRPPQRCAANHVIMREGEGGVFMYVVLQGKVAVSIQSTVVERVGPGGVFGEMALVDQSARAATATAETQAVLLAINRNDFLSLVKTKPAFAVSLLKSLAERLRHMTAHQA
jgi:CRP/FNR family transcriptional regulator, cyclic AMP receptor protein